MRRFFRRHRGFWTREHRRSLAVGVLLLVLSLLAYVRTGYYTARISTSEHFVGDIILDNIPVVNLDWIVYQGAIIFWIIALTLLVAKPEKLLFGLKAIAIFVFVRSFFVTLTHIGIYPGQIPPDHDDIGYSLMKFFTFQGNFFFSGHTGLPFLMAFVFWADKPWRRFFLACTAIFGASVLLAHVHYSIDVFSAPFITYGIFKICEHLFKEDYALLASSAYGW